MKKVHRDFLAIDERLLRKLQKLQSRLRSVGLSLNDIVDGDVIEKEKPGETTSYSSASVARPGFLQCPDCGGRVRITKVNNHPALMIGGDWKMMLWCDCGFNATLLDSEIPTRDKLLDILQANRGA